ncbi:hypothetical protein F5X68DRAFT_36113 [Plectosphaerella plurivora]|uniref:Uncharacterized protein n=1 Tax=Plectosphaerella plurivora TaxID=936078 RepID=A0A9P8V6P3_9PEZI|nr:hypothetical protein F5X68DRAFT_36113 [Plectosphaerella plurivora]
MFGTFSVIANVPRAVKIDPKDIPPPTPVVFPPSQPPRQAHRPTSSAPRDHLVTYLQSIYRPAEVTTALFDALGVRVIADATLTALLPDPSLAPDFAAWDSLSADEALESNNSTKSNLNTGTQSPGVQTYHDRKRELSIANDDAFRVVRRLPPPKGKQQARLGNAYEFYRCLEAFTTFWDDTSKPAPKVAAATDTPTAQDATSEAAQGDADAQKNDLEAESVRTSAGASMPFEYRQNIVHAFLKLIAYDFGCSAQPARVEPRLQLKAPAPPRSSYFASGCTFVYRSPRTREAARQGLIDGPIAAVSARGTTSFETDQDRIIDFAREIVAALVTAQQRTRQGKKEIRPGEGEWWTTKPRWGGGSGGPIGREIDRDAVQGDKDEKTASRGSAEGAAATTASQATTRPSGMPATKRPRKQMSIYDNYRMVRPPSSSWDPKCRYESIGKVQGAGYDDIFILSSLFHHVCILRVRVPDRLLEVLEGAEDVAGTCSWGGLEVRRSAWYDLFLVDQRIQAMQLVWGMMAWTMRQTGPEEKGEGDSDVKMANA